MVGQPDPHVYPRYAGFSTYARLPSVHEVRYNNKQKPPLVSYPIISYPR